MTLFEALTGGAFDCLNWQHSREFDQNFSKKSNALGFAWGEGGGRESAVLELTGTLFVSKGQCWCVSTLIFISGRGLKVNFIKGGGSVNINGSMIAYLEVSSSWTNSLSSPLDIPP